MTDAAEKLKPALAALSLEDRGELMNYLATLNGDEAEEDLTPEEWETAWADEINRRIADYEAGRTKLIPAEEVMARLREKYG